MSGETAAEPRVQVVDSDGQAGTIPASQLDEAQKAGYRAVTDSSELKEIQDKEEYGTGLARNAQAALMGLMRGATFGGSDEALIKGGVVSPETAKGLMEYQPATSEITKIGGQVLPMLIPGAGEEVAAEELAGAGVEGLAGVGESVLGGAAKAASPLENFGAQEVKSVGADVASGASTNAAKLGAVPKTVVDPALSADVGGAPGSLGQADTVASAKAAAPEAAEASFLDQAANVITAPVRGVSTAGEAVQRAVTGSLGEGWLGKLGGAAARGAVEGAAYGAGDAVTEDAVGNKPLTAESLMASAGMGALFGAPLGAGFEGVLGLGQKVVPSVMERASDRLKVISDRWKGGVPDAEAEVKQYASDWQKVNDAVISAKQKFEDGAKRQYAEAVLGDQNRAGDVANNFINDAEVKYGPRKIQDANKEMAEALRASRKAEQVSDAFFNEFHEKDKYAHIEKLVNHLPINPNATLSLEKAIGSLNEAEFGSATRDKFKQVISEHLANLKEVLETNEVLKDAQTKLQELQAKGPQKVVASLTDEETEKALEEANTLWKHKLSEDAEAAWRKKTGPSADKIHGSIKSQFFDNFIEGSAGERKEFVQKYMHRLSENRLAEATAANVKFFTQHAAQVKELERHIAESQAHLKELPQTKNLADQFRSLDELKKKLNKIQKPMSDTPRAGLMFEKVIAAREEVKNALENEALFGPAAKFQKEVNAALKKHYASLGEPSKPGFMQSFMKRSGTAEERELGKRRVSGNKLGAFIKALAKGGEEMSDSAGHWAAHITDTSEAAEKLAKIAYADNPMRAKAAEDVAASLKLANSKVRGAATKLAALKDEARAPRAASLAQSRAVSRWIRPLDSAFKTAESDAARFNALDSVYQKMGRSKLTEAEQSVRKQIGDMLQDTTLFGDAAKMHAATETVFGKAKLARDLVEKEIFRKPIGAGETTPQVKSGSVEARVGQMARGQARSVDFINAMNQYVDHSKEALNYLQKDVYPKISTPGTTRSTEAFLNKVQEQQAKAVAAKKYDLAHPSAHSNPLAGAGHGGALAVGLHALGIHSALPAFVLYRALKNPTQTLHVVGTAAGHTDNLVQKIAQLSRSVFEKTSGKGAMLAGPTVSTILDHVSFGSKSEGKETKAQAVSRAMADLAKLGQPDEFNTRMGKSLATLQARAPETAELVVNRGQRVVQYLLAHGPAAASPDSQLPGQKPWIPSDKDIFEFQQRVRALDDPTILLKDMQAGKLSTNAVDAVKTVYPEIYESVVSGVKAQMAQQKTPLTSVQLQQLSSLTGQSVGAVQKMLPMLQKGATSPLPDIPNLGNATQPDKKVPGSFAKMDTGADRNGTNLSSTLTKG